MTVKERLHKVVDELSDEEAEAMRSDPLLRYLDAAPIDDEPITAAEEAAIAEVEADRAAGVQRIPFDDVKRKHAE